MVPPWAQVSAILAAGLPPINTVADPFTILSGGPTQVHISPITAAGIFPISTVGTPGPMMAPPTCGMGGSPGVTIGHTCMSLILAAGGIFFGLSKLIDHHHGPFYHRLSTCREFCFCTALGCKGHVCLGFYICTFHVDGRFSLHFYTCSSIDLYSCFCL